MTEIEHPSWCTDHSPSHIEGMPGWHRSEPVDVPSGIRSDVHTELRLSADASYPQHVWIEMAVYLGVWDDVGDVDEPVELAWPIRAAEEIGAQLMALAARGEPS